MIGWRSLGRAARRRIVFGIAAAGALGALAALGLRDLRLSQQERAAFPEVEGRIAVAGLQSPVAVLRDGHGVPHVSARSERDAWFALGFVHAQDRLAQMLWLRQVARGRSAEHVGRRGLPADRLARSLDFTGLSRVEVARLPQRARMVLESFAAGVSARIERVRDGVEHAPVEVVRLGLPLDAWEPADSLALFKLHAWNRDATVEASLVLSDLMEHLGPTGAAIFFPGSGLVSESAPPDTQARAALGSAWQLAATLRSESGWSGRGLGSSAWVLGPAHSESGHPILAGDLHLDPTVPAAMHLDHVRGGGLEIAGATLPGVPIFWAGHNRKLAWFSVAASAVVIDLYVETIDPKDPSRYHDGVGWRPLERREEQIAVRGGSPERFEVRRTRNGPLLPDLGPAISVRWAGDRTDSGSGFAALLDASYAGDAHALLDALRDHREPMLAVAYADSEGAAGVKVAGYVPRRSLSPQLLPLPGRARWYQWRERVPYEALPSVRLDAAQDWVVAADAPLDVRGGGESIDWLWRSGARAARIETLLAQAAQHGPLSLRQVADLQSDVGEERAQRIAALATGLVRDTELGPQAKEVVRLLQDWDGLASADSAGAAMYHVFLAKLLDSLLKDRVGKELLARYLALPQSDPEELALELLEAADATPDATQRGALAQAVEGCMRSAWLDLSYRLGANARRWAWGTLHPLRFHPLAGADAARGALGPFAVGGSAVTVSSAPYDFASPFAATTASTLRLVVDLGAPGQALAVIAPGQSEHPGDPHAEDGIPRWLEGRAWLFATDPLLVEEGSVARLALEPVR